MSKWPNLRHLPLRLACIFFREEGTFVSIGDLSRCTVCEQNCGYSITSSASASSLLTPRLWPPSPDEP